jgi:hypothetical protein
MLHCNDYDLDLSAFNSGFLCYPLNVMITTAGGTTVYSQSNLSYNDFFGGYDSIGNYITPPMLNHLNYDTLYTYTFMDQLGTVVSSDFLVPLPEENLSLSIIRRIGYCNGWGSYLSSFYDPVIECRAFPAHFTITDPLGTIVYDVMLSNGFPNIPSSIIFEFNKTYTWKIVYADSATYSGTFSSSGSFSSSSISKSSDNQCAVQSGSLSLSNYSYYWPSGTILTVTGPAGFITQTQTLGSATSSAYILPGGSAFNYTYLPPGTYTLTVDRGGTGECIETAVFNNPGEYDYSGLNYTSTVSCSGMIIKPAVGSLTYQGNAITPYFRLISGPTGFNNQPVGVGGSILLTTPGTYTLGVLASNNVICGVGTITVNYASPPLTLNPNVTLAYGCGIGADGYISIQASGGLTPYTYQLWDNANTTLLMNGPTAIDSASGIAIFNYGAPNQTFTVRIADVCGNSFTQKVTVGNIEAASIVYSPAPSVCPGDSIQLKCIIPLAPAYSWTGPGGFTSTLQNPTILNAQSTMEGWYKVSTTTGCGAPVTDSMYIFLYAPLSGGGVSPNQSICRSTVPAAMTVSSVTGGSGSYVYQWQRSTDNLIWTDISGATSISYTPPIQNTAGTFYFRRVTTDVALYTSCGILNSAPITLTVYASLSTSSVSTQLYCLGDLASEMNPVTIGGDGNYTYQWQSSPNGGTWTNIAGATSDGYAPPTTTEGRLYYRRITTNICGSSTSSAITVIVGLITSGTSGNVTACLGESAIYTLSVTATGVSPLTYQWQSSTNNSTWANIPGAVNATYNPPVSTLGVMYYRRVTTNSCATSTSTSMTVTVSGMTTSVSGQSQNICVNGYVYITASTTGDLGNNFTYQWQSSSDTITWTNIPGEINQYYYSPAPLTTAGTYYYRRITSGNCGTSASPPITITVGIGSLYEYGNDQTVCLGGYVNQLSAYSYCDDGTFTYQWQSSTDTITWTDIPGAANYWYDPLPTTTGTVYYRCVLSGNGDTATSTAFAITVELGDFYEYGGNQTVCLGGYTNDLSFYSSCDNGIGAFNYQWQSSTDTITWTNIPGAVNSWYTPPSTVTGTFYYRCVVIDGDTATSTAFTVTVEFGGLYEEGGDQTVCLGDYVNGLVVYSGCDYYGYNGTFIYQWQSSTDTITWTDIPGAANYWYYPLPTTTGTFYYRCVLISTGGGDTATSTAFAITVEFGGFDVSGDNQTVCLREPVGELSVYPYCDYYGYNGTFTYQWQSSSDTITWTDIPGAANSWYTPTSTATGTFYYRCVLIGGGDTVTSTAFTVTVVSVITSGESASQLVCMNGAVTALSANTAGGDGIYTYQWESSSDSVTWSGIPGATNVSYMPPATVLGVIYYRRVATGSCGTSISASMTVTVKSCYIPVNPNLMNKVR